jgi:hypothetical protein
MSESQFEKMAKANQKLREENERLRGLLKRCLPYLDQAIGLHYADQCDSEFREQVEKEVNDAEVQD